MNLKSENKSNDAAAVSIKAHKVHFNTFSFILLDQLEEKAASASPDGPVSSSSDLLQVPVPLRNLPGGPVYLLPIEPGPGAQSHKH